jgi:bifunctional UDP-N-acetylglucosamine pyrophosphorylase/glucosamine-1-phosphate N-acetyltransferase
VPSPLNVAILAAGQGKRMHSARPKVLHKLAGKPMVRHVIDTARELGPRAITIVVGFEGDAVERTLAAPDLRFVRQDPPRGTGDATRVALAAMPGDGVTLVGLGDVPLVPPAAAALAAHARHGRLALLTARVRDPAGLGRVVRTRRAGRRDRRGPRRRRRAARARRDQHRLHGRAHALLRAGSARSRRTTRRTSST